MLFQILSFLLEVAGGLLTGACLLRLYMQLQKVGFSNPVGAMVFALTDWVILPLRRAIPPVGRWDVASIVAAALFQLVQYGVLALLVGVAGGAWVLWMALFGLLRVAITLAMGLLIIHAVLSWGQTASPLALVLARLCKPLLRPLRSLLPQPRGIDFSPLIALVALQVLLIVVGNLQIAALR